MASNLSLTRLPKSTSNAKQRCGNSCNAAIVIADNYKVTDAYARGRYDDNCSHRRVDVLPVALTNDTKAFSSAAEYESKCICRGRSEALKNGIKITGGILCCDSTQSCSWDRIFATSCLHPIV